MRSLLRGPMIRLAVLTLWSLAIVAISVVAAPATDRPAYTLSHSGTRS